MRRCRAGSPTSTRLALGWSPYPSAADLLEDCVPGALDELMAGWRGVGPDGGVVWDAPAFGAVPRERCGRAPGLVVAMWPTWPGYGRRREVGRKLGAMTTRPQLAAVHADVAAQRDALVYDGFVLGRRAGPRWPTSSATCRPCSCASTRRPTARAAIRERHGRRARPAAALRRRARRRPARYAVPELIEVAWMIEELRVSLFAQALGTFRRLGEAGAARRSPPRPDPGGPAP